MLLAVERTAFVPVWLAREQLTTGGAGEAVRVHLMRIGGNVRQPRGGAELKSRDQAVAAQGGARLAAVLQLHRAIGERLATGVALWSEEPCVILLAVHLTVAREVGSIRQRLFANDAPAAV